MKDYTEKIAKWVEKGKEKKVLKLLNTDNKDLKLQIIEAAGKIGGEDSINNLTFLSGNEDKDVKIAAIKALALCGIEGTITRFTAELQQEKDADVLAALKETITALKNKKK